jgi:photosystem II stability/assembly factor-like uncharacterized protein
VLDSDLDRELTRLRDDMRGALPVPGIENVVARHKQRVVRRRMQIGAAVAVLVVSLAIPLLRGQMVADPKPPASSPNHNTLPNRPFFSDVDFFDADHGYAVRTECHNGDPLKCTEVLLATADGTHWAKRALPKPSPVQPWSRASLEVLGPAEITVDWGVGESAQVNRLYSDDGGRTWQTVTLPTLVTDTVAEIPENASLTWTCAKVVGGGTTCAERGFAVVLPGSGRSALLASRPHLNAMAAGEVPTLDGRWWVAGRDPVTNNWSLAISDDSGRTWTTTKLGFRDSVDGYGWSVASSGGTLYASAIGPLPNTSNGLSAIFRSTDDGHTWQRTWQPAEDKQPRRVFGSLIPGEDGTLMINTPDGKSYVSDDGGRTFRTTKSRFGDYAYPTRAGFVAGYQGSSQKVQVSRDGVDWRSIKIE